MEKKMEIITALENAGFKHRKDFTVSVTYPGYEASYLIKIRNVNIGLQTVERIVKRFESIEWDERCMEILAGGNDYVWVKYAESKNELFNKSGKKDYSVYFCNILEEYAYKNWLEHAKKVMQKIDIHKELETNSSVKICEGDNVKVFAYRDYSLCRLKVCFAGDPNHNFEYYDYNENALAMIMAKIELGHYSQIFKEKTLYGYLKYYKSNCETFNHYEKVQFAKRIVSSIKINEEFKIRTGQDSYSRYICFDEGFLDVEHLSTLDKCRLEKLAA